MSCRPGCVLSRGTHPVAESVLATQCCFNERLESTVFKYFGYTSLRPGQTSAVLAVLHGNDVFVRMATGAGKSLCIFLPPLVTSDTSVAIIVSPLIGLMEDQISKLDKCHISAVRISGNSDQVFQEVKDGKYRFVFMSPESAVGQPWRQLFGMQCFTCKLALIAVDEAHCISEWGKDFRKCFASVGDVIALAKVPIMSLTASAPPRVETELVKALHLSDPVYIKESLNRPNIFYSVAKKSSLESDLDGVAKSLANEDPLSIPKILIYFGSKELVVKAYHFLQNKAHHKHYVGAYHASLSDETRHFVSNQFASSASELRCVCSTIAFGIGIDIPDVAVSLVYWVPETLSQFYQLSGRAGRNGYPALSVIYYTKKQLKYRSDKELQLFCEGKENCRRSHMLRSLGDSETLHCDKTTCCDVCNSNGVPYKNLVAICKKGKRTRVSKGKRVRSYSDDEMKKVEKKLKEERDHIVSQSVGLRMLGAELVCHSSSIEQLCSRVPYIKSKSDVSKVPGIRPKLCERLFNVVVDVETLHQCDHRV